MSNFFETNFKIFSKSKLTTLWNVAPTKGFTIWSKRYFFFFICLGYFLSSCHSTKYLAPQERLLRKNVIKINSKEKLKDAGTLKYELASLVKQKPNGTWALFFAEEKLFKSKKEWFKKKGTAPSIFDEEKAKASTKQLENFLFDRGYFDVHVDYDIKSKLLNDKKLIVTYTCNLNNRYTIDSISYSLTDTTDIALRRILHDLQKTSLLQKGKPVDDRLYEQEKTRITQILKNAGYANFHRNYISKLKADSSNYKVNLFLEITPPLDTNYHQTFTIGDIYIYDDFQLTESLNYNFDSLINGIHFLSKTGHFKTRPEVILENIFFQSGQVYQYSLKEKTINQLRNLGIYQYVNIRESTNPYDKNKKDFKIELTPNKRMAIGYDLEVNTSIYSTVALSLLGTSASTFFQRKNLFRKAESFKMNLEGGIQIDPGAIGDTSRQLINSLDIRSRANYLFPKFLDYMGLWKTLAKIKSKNKSSKKPDFFEDLHTKAKTRISGSISWQKLINYYEIFAINAAYGFDFQRTANKRYIFNHIGIDYLFPSNIPDDLNPFLRRSFGNQLFTGFLLKDFSLIHQSKPNARNVVRELRINVELSGLEMLLANKLYNTIAANDSIIRFKKQDIDFSKFFRLELDGRFRKQFTPKQSVAFRLNTSVASSFDKLSVPFVKQVFVGGPNSIRAWSIRELGPGSYVDTATTAPPYFQTGNLKLEFNAEYRFPILPSFYLEGAIFLDGGNIWTFKEDEARPGAKLSKNFAKEIALGTGFGIRYNYSLFLIRLDMGLKLRNNFVDEQNRYWEFNKWKTYSLKKWLGNLNYNLAIAYPF